MNLATGYRLGKRAVTRDQTRQRIIDAAERLFTGHWYDEVSLKSVADEAGVALQTVVNHFGTKGALLAAAAAEMSSGVNRKRDEVMAGDPEGAVRMIVDEYEELGDVICRFIALEGKVEELGPLLEGGREVHRAWVERVFASCLPASHGPVRRRSTAMLIAATDVLTWKVLRREQRLSRRDTELAMRTTVIALTGTLER
ncbi:MAG: TetR/AcrR family transcriptional regulator [Solirubrobacterales bacterium]|nr:TetR/AcrR family transcriptional regulator [Solirubrobacterales bacterium]MCB8914602.1 TetR/AcrR family transcriptional regulator [Thermoleophilales bacterium]